VRNDPTAFEKRCNKEWEGKCIKEYCPVACNTCDEAVEDDNDVDDIEEIIQTPTKSA